MRIIAAFLFLLFSGPTIAAPVADQIEAYRALVQQDLRLAIISYKLASANAPFCKRRERNPGWVLHDERQYPDVKIARAAFGFRQPVAISAVVPGGAADLLGIKEGYGLVAVGDIALDANTDASGKQSADRVESIQKTLRQAMVMDGGVRLTANTPEGKKRFALTPPEICASRFWVDAQSKLDAGADGDGVRITEGFMAFTSNDDAELAALVAHELAHNLLGHRERLNQTGRKTKNVLATEIEADRLSVWLMANAGYDPAAALRFTERHGRKTGLGIFSDGTHLRWNNRVKMMRAEIEIMAVTAKQNGLLPPPLLVGGDPRTP